MPHSPPGSKCLEPMLYIKPSVGGDVEAMVQKVMPCDNHLAPRIGLNSYTKGCKLERRCKRRMLQLAPHTMKHRAHHARANKQVPKVIATDNATPRAWSQEVPIPSCSVPCVVSRPVKGNLY